MRAMALLLVCLLAACTPTAARLPSSARLLLPGSDGRTHDVSAELQQHELTVFIFGAKGCGCLEAHAARLRELALTYQARGVAFRLVDSEVGADRARAMALAEDGAYPFPVLTDAGAHLADALAAEFATHSVIVDRARNVRYSGGIDSDTMRLHADAKLFLKDALGELLAGRTPRATGSEALGCVLRRH